MTSISSSHPLISVVANFYNSGKYINKLIKSIVRQTLTDWELVCVIDNSPGDDIDIINKCIKKYKIQEKVIVVVNKTNIGISKSKEVGIKNSNGKYLTFIDGDDWFANDAFRQMYEVAEKNSLDIVVMNAYKIFAKLGVKKKLQSQFDYNVVLEKHEIESKCLKAFFGVNCLSSVAYWAKLYRRDLVLESGFNFPTKENIAGEDFFFNMHVFPLANRIMFIDYFGYYWRWGGITSGSIKNADWNARKLIEMHLENYEKRRSLMFDTDNEKYLPDLARETLSVFNHNLPNLLISATFDAINDEILTFVCSIINHKAVLDLNVLDTDETRALTSGRVDEFVKYYLSYKKPHSPYNSLIKLSLGVLTRFR